MAVKKLTGIGTIACALALSLFLLSGCFGAGKVDDPNKEYRTYMSQVNQIMVDLDEGLAGFIDAVSRNDVVNMDSQIDQALKALDKLGGLDVPASMQAVQKQYLEASETLETALRDYADLYAEIDGAVQGGAAKWDDYADRIDGVQEQYDKGVKALEAADDAAAKAMSAVK